MLKIININIDLSGFWDISEFSHETHSISMWISDILSEDQELHVLVDGCNRPPELLAEGEKWTRMSQRDLEAAKNQRKLSQFFAKKPKSEKSEKSELVEMETDVKDGEVKRCRPKKVEAVIEGDGRVPSISAASIIAKVHRDRLMEGLDKEYPAYGFKAHKAQPLLNWVLFRWKFAAELMDIFERI